MNRQGTWRIIRKGQMKKKLHILLLFFVGIQIGFSQFDVPKKPEFQTSVYDYADVLNPSEEKKLESKLIRYSDSTSTQIVVISVEDLKGEDQEEIWNETS